MILLRCSPIKGPRARHFSGLVLNIPRANVFRFGDPNNAPPVFRSLQWTIKEGECWAVIGSGSGKKTELLEMLLGNLRISPPPPSGLFPFLSGRDTHSNVSMVSFTHRPRVSGGAFYDYTARYGAVREEDRITLRQSMFSDLYSPMSAYEADKDPTIALKEEAEKSTLKATFEDLATKLGLNDLLDLPFVALSNGQTRRARIIKGLISKPELLLLDEPLTGLDVNSRPTLLSLLHSLHVVCNPRVILGLRIQDPIPEWISHVAFVKDDTVVTGRKEDVEIVDPQQKTVQGASVRHTQPKSLGKALIELKDVNVGYNGHQRKVLKNINWTIRGGDRWHLQGPNGSGKTTLLSLLTGDHPQSYTQRPPTSHLNLFGQPRTRTPTTHIRARIGVISPELHAAFPRRAGMRVWEAIGTGFDGAFVPQGADGVGVGLNGELSADERAWRVSRVREVLRYLGPSTWTKNAPESADEAFAQRPFVDLSAGEQSMVLLMRALVGRPLVALLDEVWSGMDESMVRAACEYLRGDAFIPEQAVVVISHWEDEVPWSAQDGVRRFRLDDGYGFLV